MEWGEATNRQAMLAARRARNENQRRLILAMFVKPKMVLSIDELAFQTKLQREHVAKRLNDCPWFQPHKTWGARKGHHQLSEAGRLARRQGLHLQEVKPAPPRPAAPRRAKIAKAIAETGKPSPYWKPDGLGADYIPNEEQIQAAIAEVQATWNDEERWKRRTSLAEPLGSLE